MVKNIVAVYKGDTDFDDAAASVAKDTASAAAMGYGTGFTGSAIKGAMQNSKSQYLRTVSKTNLPER